MKYIVIHYSEIGTKGKNREFFERKLIQNIQKKIKVKEVLRDYGQFILGIDASEEEIKKKLVKIPGIANFLIADQEELDIGKIKEKALIILKEQEFETFKVETARHKKDFHLTSKEINEQVGEYLVKQLGKKVKLKQPERTLYVEVCNKNSYLSLNRVQGLGGLPVGCAGKAIALVSGGIDSPVASFLMMKRGCEVSVVHFQNETLAKEGVKDKIQQLSKKLNEYQNTTTLYIVPFGDLQREIIEKCPSEMRMLIYRYFMLKIAEKIAEKENVRALITGDNLSQVASQTLENLEALYSFAGKLMLSPVIGLSKEEIINIAKEIGTYEISILPYGDCCSFFVAEHPELRATREKIEKSLDGINVEGLIEKVLEKVEIEDF